MCLPTSAKGKEDMIDIMVESSMPWPGDDDAAPTFRSKITLLYNNWTYSYMNRIFSKGSIQKKDKSIESQLTLEDLYQIPSDNQSYELNKKFWLLYEETNGNFFNTLWKLAAPTFILAGYCQLVALIAQLSIPMCVMKLLIAVENIDSDNINNNSDADMLNSESLVEETMPYVMLIFVLSIINGLCTHRSQFLSYQSGIIIRSAVTSAIYEKSLKLSPKGREGLTSGIVTNLVATDTQKLFEVMHDGHMIWAAPLAILIVVVLMFILIGPSCFIGALILVALVPISKRVASMIVQIRKLRIKVADERIEIITAMLQGIKVTKLNNYEDKFEKRVAETRRREMKIIRKEQAVWGLTLVIRVFTPVLASAATFATYVLVSPNNIMTASIVFTLAMLFNMLKFPINAAGQLLSKAALGVQAMQRISHFMERESILDMNDTENNINMQKVHDGCVIEVKNATFYVGTKDFYDDDEGYNKESTTSATTTAAAAAAAFTLSNVNFSVARGEVLAVVGEVAAGKTTLIQGLLGDIPSSDNSSITISGKKMAFAGQTPFILSSSVRDNILFGSLYDKKRYDEVLDACCLRDDCRMWPAGDLTQIGERGVTMSGGQKARVGLARAVYANADVCYLDDILSAIDAGTSQRVFENLFDSATGKGLLSNCGVVLVTHALHVLQRVSRILVLDTGNVLFYGTWMDLQLSHDTENEKLDFIRISLQSHTNQDTKKLSAEENTEPISEEMTEVSGGDSGVRNGEIMTKEEREHGVSALAPWLRWFNLAGGVVFIIIQILLLTLDRGSYVAIDWWLATWTSAVGKDIVVFGLIFPDQLDGRSSQYSYLIVYAVIIVTMFIFLVGRCQWAIFGGARACERIFSNMTRCVLLAPMSYYDTTPLGRILNRFTYDVEQVDITLTQFMSIFMIACSWLVAGQVVMITLVPFMAIINGFVLALYVLILRHYRWSANDIQRLDAVSRSPVQAAMAEGIDGCTAIRAFGKNDYFLNIFQCYINDNSSAMLNFVSSRRWIAVRLETIGAFVTLAACLFITTFNDHLGLSPGLSGLLIIWATSMTVTLGFLINAFNEAEAAITSIERMHSMEMLPQEKSMVTSDEYKVDDTWPCKGLLEFDNVSLRYRPGLPLSLNELSFTIQHGQRCAVVGRTGAGEYSSVIFSILLPGSILCANEGGGGGGTDTHF
jgi:ABC-type multidrug transport system fused ATPase/permease subunit